MAKKTAVLDLAVSFGNVNFGDKTVRVGVSTPIPGLTVTTAYKNLCDRRLTGELLARAGDAESDQPSFPGADNDIKVKGTFDVKGFNCTKKAISFGLTFMIEEIEIDQFAHLAKRKGTLTVYEIADIPEEQKAAFEAHDGEEE